MNGLERAAGLLKCADKLDLEERESLPSREFAIPKKRAKKIGVEHEIKGESEGKYPIPDLAHARNALARVSQHGTPEEREAVRRKVYAKYPQLRESFEKSHGGESPTSKENIRKVEQGNIGKESCFKVAAIRAFSDEVAKIAAAPIKVPIRPRATPPPIPADALKATPRAARPRTTPSSVPADAYRGKPPIVLTPYNTHLWGNVPHRSFTDPRDHVREILRTISELEPSMVKSGGLGRAILRALSKSRQRVVGTGPGGAALSRAIERGGWTSVGTVPTGYVARAPAVRPMTTLEQNIAERGLSL